MKLYEMFLLCCPLLSPHMIGTLFVAPLTVNVSVLQTVSADTKRNEIQPKMIGYIVNDLYYYILILSKYK